MRRKHDGAIWKRITNDKTGKIADIRLSKHGRFSCKIDDEHKGSFVASEVESWAEKIIAIPDAAIVWIPVMHVRVEQDRYSFGRRKGKDLDIELKLKADRLWITRTSTGLWREIAEWAKLDPKSPGRMTPEAAFAESNLWSTANNIERPDERYGDKRKARLFTLPHQYGEGDVILAYDETLWQGVTKLVHAIEREFEMINELLGTAEGHKQLREIGAGSAAFALEAEVPSTKEEQRRRGKRS